jgi:diphthamide synthase subunit DPH2
MIDWDRLEEAVRGRKEVAILSSEEYKSMIQPIHNFIKQKNPETDIWLLNGGDILCPTKTEEFDLYVTLGVECPVHRFSSSIPIRARDRAELSSPIDNAIFDSTHSMEPGPASSEEEAVVVTRNQRFYDYHHYSRNVRPFYDGIEIKDKMQYLMAQCNRGERIKKLEVFAVVFTSKVYEELAASVRDALVSRSKSAYLLFLKDLSYERLITIEGVECVVVVDCPLFDCSHIDLHIPIVTPFEVRYALSNEWESGYSRNSFGIVPLGACKELTVSGRAGRILMSSGFQGVPHELEEDDMDVHVGHRGTAQRYDFE